MKSLRSDVDLFLDRQPSVDCVIWMKEGGWMKWTTFALFVACCDCLSVSVHVFLIGRCAQLCLEHEEYQACT